MATKFRIGRGLSSLGDSMMEISRTIRQERAREAERDQAFDNAKELVGLRDANATARAEAGRVFGAELEQSQFDRDNAPVFDEGASINGMEIPEAFIGMGPRDLGRAMEMQRLLSPDAPTGAPRTTVTGRDGLEYSLTDAQALEFNNPDPADPVGPIDTRDTARDLFGFATDRGSLKDGQPRSAVFQRGDLFNQGQFPLDISQELASAFDDSVRVSELPKSRETGEAALRDVMAGVDPELGAKMGADLAKSMEGWKWDEKKQQYKHPSGLLGMATKHQPSARFFTDVIEPLLADGTDKVEFDTIQAWLKKNEYTLEELVSGLSPASLDAIESQAAPDGPQAGPQLGEISVVDGVQYEFVGGAEQWREVR